MGQPAPRAMSPVMMPARSRLAAFCSRFLCQRRTVRPIKVPCNNEMQKTGSQSRNGWLTPKMPMKLSPMIRRPSGKPKILINSNLERPPDSRFINKPKNRKLGINPYQKRFSLVASRMPLPAKTNSSHHFLQFINIIISHGPRHVYILLFASDEEKL